MNRRPQNPLLRRSTMTAAVLAALTVSPLPVQAFDEPGHELSPRLLDRFSRLSEHMDQKGWENEYEFIESAIKNVWQRNGWSDEADRFARETTCEIAAVPPWEPQKRMRLLHQRIEQRYGLSGDSAARFRAATVREAARFLMRNAGVILEQMGEGMLARTQGAPFTPEQVARWTKQGQPMLAELQESADRLARELEPMLPPAKRRIFERDLKSFRKRQQAIDKMAARWAGGQWQPAEWGLQDDPIHNLGAPADPYANRDRKRSKRRLSSAREPRKPLTIGRWFPHAPSTWLNYLLDFQQRFDLDTGQLSTGKSIHAEMVLRADRYIEAHADVLKTVEPASRTTDEAYEPVCSLFEEFQSRLSAIPTSGQRDRKQP